MQFRVGLKNKDAAVTIHILHHLLDFFIRRPQSVARKDLALTELNCAIFVFYVLTSQFSSTESVSQTNHLIKSPVTTVNF